MSREHLSPEQRTLIAFSDVLNALAGRPFCGACCEHGGACTLEPDHEGDHKIVYLTGDDRGTVVCIFTDEEAI